MSDRRQREPARCLVAGCVHVGYWFASYGRCPVHFNEFVEQTRAAIVRARSPEPLDPPLSTVLGGRIEEGAPPR